jgi:ribonuclease G
VALVDGSTLLEFYQENSRAEPRAGSVYLGRVARVVPGMQAAFVDIGLPKASFLHASDANCRADLTNVLDVGDDGTAKMETNGGRIEQLLTQGQEVMVQIAKEPLGNKGARVTSQVTLPGRNLVLMPDIDHVGVSRRIHDEEERARMRAMLDEMRPPGIGFIARTASEGKSAEKLKAELDFLVSLWNDINQRRGRSVPPCLLHRDLSVGLRAVRDLFTHDVDHLVIDSPREYEQVLGFVGKFMPSLLPCVELYQARKPIFDAYRVEAEVARALDRKVWLKSGGYLVIEKTEALTTIDVNTGRYLGGDHLEDTFLKTNMEAVKEITYQIRLRDIGGLIVIDFIDMEREANRQLVVEALREALTDDRSRTKVLGMSELGLVEMTRKRVRESLEEGSSQTCTHCGGLGITKNPPTVCYEIFRALERDWSNTAGSTIRVLAHPAVAEELLQSERYALEELEDALGITVQVENVETAKIYQFCLSQARKREPE